MVGAKVFMCRVGVVPRLDCLVLLGWDGPLLITLMTMKWRTQACALVGHPIDQKWADLPLGEGKLAHLTEQDPTLRHAHEAAQNLLLLLQSGPFFQLMSRVLHRCCGNLTQLMVPTPLRDLMLQLAHDLSLAGHQVAEKTLACIQHPFYWPGIKAQVQRDCASCPECPMPGDPEMVCPMPIVMIPFERIGVDIVGLLAPAA